MLPPRVMEPSGEGVSLFHQPGRIGTFPHTIITPTGDQLVLSCETLFDCTPHALHEIIITTHETPRAKFRPPRVNICKTSLERVVRIHPYDIHGMIGKQIGGF